MYGWTDGNSGDLNSEASPQAQATPQTQQSTPQVSPISTPAANQITDQQLSNFWNEHRGDPAAIAKAMLANNVDVGRASKLLGVDQQSMSDYLNTGRNQGPSGPSPFWDGSPTPGDWNYDKFAPIGESRADFNADVAAHQSSIGADGKFLGPSSGVNYRWEGMTPDQVFEQNAHPYVPPSFESLYAATPADHVNLNWEPGPDNGGGLLAGVGRAIGNMGTGIAHTPPLMMALTAGVGSYFAPVANSGVTAGGLETGGSAGLGSGTVLGGGAASVDPGIIQSVMTSPYAPVVKVGLKTAASGGSPTDFVRNLAGDYVSSNVANAARDMGVPGSGVVGNVVGTAVTGGDPLKALISSGTSAAVGSITSGIDGFDELPNFQKTIVNNAIIATLQGKKPTQALIDQARNAALIQMKSGKVTPSQSGWSE
jgi:hypothetical protein